jgi:hypothetical protein
MAWYFLRVPGCGTKEAVESYKAEIARLGRIYEYDLGTETCRSAGWYTVNIPFNTVREVRERLRDLGLSEHVDQIEGLMRARDGRAFSRQLGLF